jgi:hypothetical protein
MQRQARAPQTQPFGAEAFQAADTTVLRWLGMAGFFINSRGTSLIVDPLLGGFVPVYLSATVLPLLLLGGQWEEPGWMGYAQRRYQDRLCTPCFLPLSSSGSCVSSGIRRW